MHFVVVSFTCSARAVKIIQRINNKDIDVKDLTPQRIFGAKRTLFYILHSFSFRETIFYKNLKSMETRSKKKLGATGKILQLFGL